MAGIPDSMFLQPCAAVHLCIWLYLGSADFALERIYDYYLLAWWWLHCSGPAAIGVRRHVYIRRSKHYDW